MTKREALRECRKMWLWLAKHPDKWKASYLLYDCPCCRYVFDKTGVYPTSSSQDKKASPVCKQHCPLIALWPTGCIPGIFGKWVITTNLELRSTLARKIADACLRVEKNESI